MQPARSRPWVSAILRGKTLTPESSNRCFAGTQYIYSHDCIELGIVIVAPDTSPWGDGVPDDPEGAWDFGLGAGFYVDATQAPWSQH